MKKNPDDYSGLAKTLKEVGPYMGLGLQLAATIVVMILIGDWLDKKFEHNLLFTLIFAFAGIGIGMYNLIKTVTQLEKRKKTNEKE